MKWLVSSLFLAIVSTPSIATAASIHSLMADVQFVPSSSVSAEVHTHLKGTYVSVWATGIVGISHPEMDLTGTVHVARNNRTVRMQGALRIVPEGTFLRVDSVEGSLRAEDSSIVDAFPVRGRWLQILPSTIAEHSLAESTWFSVLTGVSGNPDFVYDMSMQRVGQSKEYIITLKPDAAAKLATSLLNILGKDRPKTQDFFPWRSYADSLQFRSTVRVDQEDRPLSRTSRVRVDGSNSYMNFSINETFLSEIADFSLPKESIPFNNSLNIFRNQQPSEAFSNTTFDNRTPPVIDANFDTVDRVNEVTCSTAGPLELISLKRGGACPTPFVSRRNLQRQR